MAAMNISTYLHCGLFHELDTTVQLAEFVMASTGVSENLNAIESHQNMGTTADDQQLMQATLDFLRTDLAGVKSSSHSSTPIQVSTVLITASPKGTLVYGTCISIIQMNTCLHSHLPSYSMDEARQVVIFDLTVLRPGSEPPKFTIVAIVGHPQLRAVCSAECPSGTLATRLLRP